MKEFQTKKYDGFRIFSIFYPTSFVLSIIVHFGNFFLNSFKSFLVKKLIRFAQETFRLFILLSVNRKSIRVLMSLPHEKRLLDLQKDIVRFCNRGICFRYIELSNAYDLVDEFFKCKVSTL